MWWDHGLRWELIFIDATDDASGFSSRFQFLGGLNAADTIVVFLRFHSRYLEARK